MLATRHTQSLTDFRQKATETLDRLNRTGKAEILTVNGEARAVLLSPSAFDELTLVAQLDGDVAAMRRAIQELESGKGQEMGVFFDGLRAQLLVMKARGENGNGK